MVEIKDRDAVMEAAKISLPAVQSNLIEVAKKFTEGNATLADLQLAASVFRFALSRCELVKGYGMVEIKDRDAVVEAAKISFNAAQSNLIEVAKDFTEGDAKLSDLQLAVYNFRFALADYEFIKDNTLYEE